MKIFKPTPSEIIKEEIGKYLEKGLSMNKTIKVIDLLNKIANGEEVPEKIKIETHIFTRFDYSKGDGTYISSYQSDDGQYYIQDYSYPKDLNREVEIIEDTQEHKIPEKLIPTSLRGIDNLDEKIEVAHVDTISAIDKINEIIDYLEVNND